MAEFRTIHTTYGLAAMAAAEAAGTPINLTHMAVGDGNGNDVTPSETQTNLVREVFRATINRVYQDPTTPNRFTAELVIPAATGGFVLREVGIFDSTGSLFAVGNLPATYKPVASDGAFADTIVRLEFLVTNASVVNIIIDPSVAVASQTWVLNNINACHVLPGGTTGQVLRKKTNSCGDTEWADPLDVNVIVDVVEEEQTLVALQTVVTWSIVTTNGLAVYVEGVRIPQGAGAGKWSPDPSDPDTTIILGTSYPVGTKILGVQNDPVGDVPFPLVRDQNLADVPDKAAARTNLDVFSRAESRQLSPAGQVAYFARNTAPTGWLKANGAAVSRTAYADLFAAIGTTFGAGDGFNTFNLPDLRGEFLRGWDDGRGVDTGRAIGTAQSSQNLAHNHTGTTSAAGAHQHETGAGQFGTFGSGNAHYSGFYDGAWVRPVDLTSAAGSHQHTIASDGGSEARPRNVALLACIKF